MALKFLISYIFSKRSGSLIRTIGWLSLAGVALSSLALIVVISVMQGFGQGIRERILSVEPHLVVKSKNSAKLQSLVEQLNLKTGIRASLFESQDVILRTVEGLYGGGLAQGMGDMALRETLQRLEKRKKRHRSNNELELAEREFLESTASFQAGEIVIGSDLADSLNIYPGDEVVLISPEGLLLPPGEVPNYEAVRVKQILRSDVPQIDSQLILYGLGKSLKRLPYRKPEVAVDVRMDDPFHFESLKEEMKSQGFEVASWVDRNSGLFYSLKMEKFLMTTFLTLTYLIGSFSIVTLLVLLATQKKSDMGILQALGMSKSNVRRLFAKMGIALTAMGMGAGIILGLIICWWIDKFDVIQLPPIYYDRKLPIEIDFPTISLSLVGVFAVSVAIAILTSRQSADMSPVECLRA